MLMRGTPAAPRAPDVANGPPLLLDGAAGGSPGAPPGAQPRQQPPYDAAAVDTWACGVLLYLLITGASAARIFDSLNFDNVRQRHCRALPSPSNPLLPLPSHTHRRDHSHRLVTITPGHE